MATLTTHVLDSQSGAHAAGLGVTLHRIHASGARTRIFSAVTDSGGRLRKTVQMQAADAGMTCELAFQSADYFARQSAPGGAAPGILREAVVRLVIADPDAVCHIPMMLAPNSYSVWCSDLG